MAALPAISADSFGNRTQALAGLPPLTDRPGTPADREQLVRWTEVARRDPPGQWTDDRWQQARSFTAGVYIAVNTIMTAVGGGHAVVLQRKPGAVGKSLSSAAGSEESEWAPVEASHPLARLFADPNEVDTFSEWLSEYVLCLSLFGLGAVMWNPGRDGKPAELWNLRANYLTAVQGLSGQYPRGAWRYYLPRPMLWGASGQLTIPREQVVLHRRPHPLFPWDGYSPLTAGGKLVDFLNSVIDSRQMAMDRGLSLDAVIAMAGASTQQVEQLDAAIRQKYTGANRGQRFMTTNADGIDVKLLGSTPDKMSYADSYQHGVQAVLALFGVPAVCAFLADADYSGFYASARAWRDGNLNSLVRGISDRLTKSFVRPHWGDEFKVEIKLPPLMDPEQRERQWQLLNGMTSAVLFTGDEARAAFDMGPMKDGHLTPAELSARIQKANQPAMPGVPGADPSADPIAALLGGDPNAEPQAAGDVANPDVGAASEGSLPGSVSKSVNLSAYFAQLVEEVCA